MSIQSELCNESKKMASGEYVAVCIKVEQYAILIKATDFINRLGCDSDNTPGHILREFIILDDIEEILSSFIDGVDVSDEIAAIMRENYWEWKQQGLLKE